MCQEMPMSWPNSPLKAKMPILIYGGSSAMWGTCHPVCEAVSLSYTCPARFLLTALPRSGYEVLITAGISNFEYVKSLGADAFFDLRSPTVGEDIRAHTNDELYHAFDTIGEYGSPEASAKALASKEPEGQKLYYGNILLKDISHFMERNGKFADRPNDVVFSCPLDTQRLAKRSAFEMPSSRRASMIMNLRRGGCLLQAIYSPRKKSNRIVRK
ncbi:hypothetical protein PMIN06_007835 [Paraphaeosphaeria minitans]